MNVDKIKKKLKEKLSEKRYEHTMGVAYTAASLAMRYDADMEKAFIAGLLHDCAKHLPSNEKLKKARKYKLEVSEYEKKNPELLHAKLGASYAIDKYGVSDPEILSAITWHTTGCPGMTLLDKIVYIADYMEPNRCQASNLSEVRKLAFEDIDQCLLKILKDSVEYLNSQKMVIDPMTQLTYEYYSRELK